MTVNGTRQAALAAATSFLTLGGLGLDALAEQAGHEAELLGDVRQLTFEGLRAGEGYFSGDGTKLIFQSEREADNPFYQIYLMDLETGDTERLSTGVGKTTCAWIHPDHETFLFASTHLDPDALVKQEEEFAEREKGTRRYSWSFDENYDIFESRLDGTGGLTNLTETLGYDAEASYSPDGGEILFASNRHAYEAPLSPDDQARFEKDPSFFMELYVMNADGTDVRRLTDTPGYDGGPFYSADGETIVWRRFGEDGHSAEIFTMNRDGTGERRITDLGAMSWAPYFHPSGDYVIFGTSVHGFANFELYIVDSAGEKDPVRVTSSETFDSLPVFSPDGRTLAWASSRTVDKKAQLFMADWNDDAARALLGLEERVAVVPGELPPLPESEADISPDDLRLHVEALASEAMEGRLTGTHGERMATDYVAKAFERLGLEPAGDDGSFFQPFDFTADVSLGEGNQLEITGIEATPEVDRDWRPLGMSEEGEIAPGGITFAGYGVVAPKGDNSQSAYDSYAGLDVEGKWVMIFRHLPEDIGAERRQHLHRYADLGYKAAVARERGAVGLIVASGPNAGVEDELVPLGFDAATAGSTLGAISVSNDLASVILSGLEKDLGKLQSELDEGEEVPGFEIPDVGLEVTVELEQEIQTGRNVLARLAADGGGSGAVMVGAHVDHLGRGVEGKSLATGDQQGQIHFGADDNASGVAGLLEIAEYLADQKAKGKLDLPRDLVFAVWSGEELGLLGSSHFVKRFAGDTRETLQPEIAAYLNLDMIGHYRDSLILQGVGSSAIWPGEIERRNVPVGLSITTNDNAFLPTDATSFYLKGVPVLNAFTGPHSNYSTPADQADTLNYEGAAKVARLMALITRAVAKADDVPDYIKMQPGKRAGRRRTSSVYLGTLPDYGASDAEGALINGVTDGGPAAEAGIEGGDLIVEIAGSKIANIYDYSHALDGLKIGQPVDLVVMRGGKRKTVRLTPSSRD